MPERAQMVNISSRIKSSTSSSPRPHKGGIQQSKRTLWMCQVGEMCSGGNRNGVEGGLWDGWLWTSWRTLGSHQHHCRVGWCRVVRGHHTRLHMGLQVRKGVTECAFLNKKGFLPKLNFNNPFYQSVCLFVE